MRLGQGGPCSEGTRSQAKEGHGSDCGPGHWRDWPGRPVGTGVLVGGGGASAPGVACLGETGVLLAGLFWSLSVSSVPAVFGSADSPHLAVSKASFPSHDGGTVWTECVRSAGYKQASGQQRSCLSPWTPGAALPTPGTPTCPRTEAARAQGCAEGQKPQPGSQAPRGRAPMQHAPV